MTSSVLRLARHSWRGAEHDQGGRRANTSLARRPLLSSLLTPPLLDNGARHSLRVPSRSSHARFLSIALSPSFLSGEVILLAVFVPCAPSPGFPAPLLLPRQRQRHPQPASGPWLSLHDYAWLLARCVYTVFLAFDTPARFQLSTGADANSFGEHILSISHLLQIYNFDPRSFDQLARARPKMADIMAPLPPPQHHQQTQSEQTSPASLPGPPSSTSAASMAPRRPPRKSTLVCDLTHHAPPRPLTTPV